MDPAAVFIIVGIVIMFIVLIIGRIMRRSINRSNDHTSTAIGIDMSTSHDSRPYSTLYGHSNSGEDGGGSDRTAQRR